jgi:endonuclease G
MILPVLGAFIAFGAQAADQPAPKPLSHCESFSKYGTPQDHNKDAVTICRTAYEVRYDPEAKIPIWVVYTLTSNHAIGCVARSNAFSSDQSLAREQRSTLADYAGSGYDTGHIANDADMSWDETVERESFLLSNMTPQTPELNRGIWKTLETAVRAWTYNNDTDITVYAGPIYDVGNDKHIGPNKVVVPTAFYKIVIDNKKKESLAFIFENSKKEGKDLTNYQVTVQDVEKVTGIKFSVPDAKTDKHDIWTINTILLSTAKKKKCGN